jgi:hypothetical protein
LCEEETVFILRTPTRTTTVKIGAFDMYKSACTTLSTRYEILRIKRPSPRPATTVLNHYYQLLRTGKLNHLVAFEVYFARIRGREWVISLDPKYPEDSSDRAHDYSHYYLKTPEQRAFIKASTVPLAEQKEYSQTSRRKGRRAGAKVTFAPEIFVRSEADIDVLRKQALSSSKITRNTFSWLRALFAKVFAKPLFEVRDLCDGPYRPQINYRRPYNVGALGTWSAPTL